ncbi:MAG TPA: copper chaperone [Ignavibacteria bacterium]|nr:copper chaperone [Ignavibacteria bacterium]
MKREQFEIEGMTCEHCVKSVQKELSKLDIKVKGVKVGSADIKYDATKVSKEQIAAAINEAGYKLVNA